MTTRHHPWLREPGKVARQLLREYVMSPPLHLARAPRREHAGRGSSVPLTGTGSRGGPRGVWSPRATPLPIGRQRAARPRVASRSPSPPDADESSMKSCARRKVSSVPCGAGCRSSLSSPAVAAGRPRPRRVPAPGQRTGIQRRAHRRPRRLLPPNPPGEPTRATSTVAQISSARRRGCASVGSTAIASAARSGPGSQPAG
jgi:hypothetical protein